MNTLSSILGRSIALFPGAFRPPHVAHLTAVKALLDRPDIDEVAIIISNRSRAIPNTTQVLDADVALHIWQIYLAHLESEQRKRIWVELAPHAAVDHALTYFERAESGDRLLFCLGQADAEQHDPRFRAVETLGSSHGIDTEVIIAPTGNFTIRATKLRQALGDVVDGWNQFRLALPPELTTKQKQQVWQICRNETKSRAEIVAQRVRAVLERAELGALAHTRPIGEPKADPVLRITFDNGQVGYAKYAGDTVDHESIGNPNAPKPRRRLGTERRAIRRLRKCGVDQLVNLPEVIYFDKATRTLLLNEVCPGGESLVRELSAGIFDPKVAQKLGRFLGRCHSLGDRLKPVWGEAELDTQHWMQMLASRTTQIAIKNLSGGNANRISSKLIELHKWSQREQHTGFFHLDLQAKNVLHVENKVGIIDLELSSTVGDPAYDLGVILGEYLTWGSLPEHRATCSLAAHSLLDAYQSESTFQWAKIAPRVSAFAGAALLHNRIRIESGFLAADVSCNHLALLAEKLLMEEDDPFPTVEISVTALVNCEDKGYLF